MIMGGIHEYTANDVFHRGRGTSEYFPGGPVAVHHPADTERPCGGYGKGTWYLSVRAAAEIPSDQVRRAVLSILPAVPGTE